MIRTVLLAVTAAAGVSAAQAAPRGAYYVATPEAATDRPAVMTRATSWTLRDGQYIAARAPERDAVQCELAVRGLGRLSAFSAGGTTFDAAQLDKCNRRAPAAGAAAVAAR